MKNTRTTQDQSTRTRSLVISAMMVAVIAVCSWISIPLPGMVPINLATAAVIVTGLLLGRKWGCISVGIFLLLGAIGVPVFAGFSGGISDIIGPTGGYLIGYMTLVFGVGWAKDSAGPNMSDFPGKGSYTATVIVGEALLYALGTVWYVYLTGTTLAVALTACVIPFIPGDTAKAIIAYILAKRISKTL